LLKPVQMPDLPPRGIKASNHDADVIEAEERPRKKRKISKTRKPVFADDVRAQEELGDVGFTVNKSTASGHMNAKKRKRSQQQQQRPVFTTAQIEIFTQAEKVVSRKKPKNPNHAAINVWQSGKVGILGRTEEHLFDAAVVLVRLLAQFTMSH
jgi:hypothetical protein